MRGAALSLASLKAVSIGVVNGISLYLLTNLCFGILGDSSLATESQLRRQAVSGKKGSVVSKSDRCVPIEE